MLIQRKLIAFSQDEEGDWRGHFDWGHLQLLEGRLHYQDETGFAASLEGGDSNWVQPEVVHHIQPDGQIRLCIDFYRSSSAPTSSKAPHE